MIVTTYDDSDGCDWLYILMIDGYAAIVVGGKYWLMVTIDCGD